MMQHQMSMQIQSQNQQDQSQQANQDLMNFRSDFEQYQRFQLDLEFVNMLANPYYILQLQEYDYFSNERFQNYLKYLSYFKQPEYFKFVKYPLGIKMLDLIQQDKFIENLSNNGIELANKMNIQNTYTKQFLNYLAKKSSLQKDIKKEEN
ncbi:mediator of RNA polymerase II transcription subunit, putative (macronuclear) [Tetrahymena thermophila SB210]|uniref:Mediator of RNA polymerase II transcription subunit 31 n=1 Tax=Tetrahymena thermophila (strain SB210) TaxID=312017 RepID=Q22Y25_TETTS|nr:mediator of RNA polymerase II transcription subunit, putative [Tetrahymena thermophila SB210]EAR90199.3 mediator of RNA polymerase II transcription subunit, putative [Tetrahymena thermophila SB210]|eukprot:XP_001010444.3 mediator of RNA polymerase II transcription subunit, putative [Tetrahymena thermophila SB210]